MSTSEWTHSYVKCLYLLTGTKVTEQFTGCKGVRLCCVCKGFCNKAVMFELWQTTAQLILKNDSRSFVDWVFWFCLGFLSFFVYLDSPPLPSLHPAPPIPPPPHPPSFFSSSFPETSAEGTEALLSLKGQTSQANWHAPYVWSVC